MPHNADSAIACFASTELAAMRACRECCASFKSTHPTGPHGLLDRRVDCVELVIAGDNFLQLAGIGIFFKYDEVLEERQQAAGFEHAPHERIQFQNAAGGIASALDGAPDL